MTNCKLSIIIPLYQKALYIHECIDSLYTQGISEELFEVIIVDDGSSDGGGILADTIVRDHANLRVIHIQHKGTGAARNAGLREAKGDYIHFVDADDVVLPNAYSRLMPLIQDKQADIVFFDYEREGRKKAFQEEECIVYTGSIHEYIRENRVNVNVWNKWFRKEFLTAHQTAFPLYSYSEDTAFTFNVLKYDGSLLVTNLPVYYYRVCENSIEQSRYVKVVKETILNLICTNMYLKNVASSYKDCPAVRGNFSLKYHVLFNRILCTPYCYKELKRVFSQCAEIGIEHLNKSKFLRMVNFLYHHPFFYYVCHPLILHLYFLRFKVGKDGTDFIGGSLRK